MSSKDHIAGLRAGEGGLSAKLIDTFSRLHKQDAVKPADLITRLKEQMELALRSSADASD